MILADDVRALIGPIAFDPDEIRARYEYERDKRIRPDGNDQYVEVTAGFSHFAADPFVEPGFTRTPISDHVDVAIVGAGFGALLLAARLRDIGVQRIRLIDPAGDVGGTWYWNRYPGAMCDVESSIYLPLLEEVGTVPKHRYSFAPEILEHSRAIARKYDLYDDACFQTSVTSMEWNDDAARWLVRTDRGDAFTASFVAVATGLLSRPKLPGITGINEFRGHTFHTSRWDYRYTGGDNSGNLAGLRDKRVGIIGTGATAVQCIPHLGRSSKSLTVFQRTPSSIDVRNNRSLEPNWTAALPSGWQKRRMDNFNILVSGGDQDEDLIGDGWTDIYRNLTGTAAKRAAQQLGRAVTSEERAALMELADMRKMEQIRGRVDAIVHDPETAAKLKPWYRQFCKRPCFHDEYLDTYNLPNVRLVDTAARDMHFTEHALVVDGTAYDLDCLVFATGFEVGTSYNRRAGLDMTGRNGVSLAQKWSDGLKTLHGLQTHGFPNCFVLGATQSTLTVNIPHTLDEQAHHIAYLLRTARERGATIVEATAEGEQMWVEEMRSKAHLGVAFYAQCTPGYYNNEGRGGNPNGYFAAAYGGGSLRYFEILEEWRADGTMPGVELRSR